jgi:hypothetical protein
MEAVGSPETLYPSTKLYSVTSQKTADLTFPTVMTNFVYKFCFFRSDIESLLKGYGICWRVSPRHNDRLCAGMGVNYFCIHNSRWLRPLWLAVCLHVQKSALPVKSKWGDPPCLMLQIGLTLLGVVLVVAVVNFWLLIPAAVMFAFIYVLRLYYVSTSRSIKRLEGISKLTCFLLFRRGPLCFHTLYGWVCMHTWQIVICL